MWLHFPLPDTCSLPAGPRSGADSPPRALQTAEPGTQPCARGPPEFPPWTDDRFWSRSPKVICALINKHVCWPQADLVDADSALNQPNGSGRNYFECESHLLINKMGHCLPCRKGTTLIECCSWPVQALLGAPDPWLCPPDPDCGSCFAAPALRTPARRRAPLSDLLLPHASESSVLPYAAWGLSHHHDTLLTFFLHLHISNSLTGLVR